MHFLSGHPPAGKQKPVTNFRTGAKVKRFVPPRSFVRFRSGKSPCPDDRSRRNYDTVVVYTRIMYPTRAATHPPTYPSTCAYQLNNLVWCVKPINVYIHKLEREARQVQLISPSRPPYLYIMIYNMCNGDAPATVEPDANVTFVFKCSSTYNNSNNNNNIKVPRTVT